MGDDEPDPGGWLELGGGVATQVVEMGVHEMGSGLSASAAGAASRGESKHEGTDASAGARAMEGSGKGAWCCVLVAAAAGGSTGGTSWIMDRQFTLDRRDATFDATFDGMLGRRLAAITEG